LEISAAEKALIELVNQERAKAGLPPVKPNPQLFKAARAHAADMAACEQCEHTLHGKGSSRRIEDAGYDWIEARENIAYNQRTPEEVHRDWMESEGHRDNILAKSVTEIGVGVAKSAKGELYFAQNLARPQRDLVEYNFSIASTAADNLRVEFAGKTSLIKPGMTMNYSLSTADPLPHVVLHSGGNKAEIIAADKGRYRVLEDGGGLHVWALAAPPR
jgi:hypothetical protein